MSRRTRFVVRSDALNGRRIFRDDRPTLGFGISDLFSPSLFGDRGDDGRIYAARPRSREAMDDANENTVLMVIVETAEGAENIDEICETPGIDAVWLGHADLSVSLGVAGDLESEVYREAEQ